MQKIESSSLKEAYKLVEHPSGLKVYLYKKSGYKSCHAVFGTKYGSVDVTFSRDGKNYLTVTDGIAHFLEHKLFESEELDAFELFAKTGAYANAYTSFDRTCYLFGCSNNLEENLKILLNFVQSPYFTKETVEKEQGIIGQEIKMYLDSPDWRVLFNLLGALYHVNPVKIDIAGSVESISKIDDKLLYECYSTFYNPQNMFLVVVGDFDEDKIYSLIDEGIKKPYKKVEILREIPSEPDSIVTSYTEQKLEVAKPLFMLGYKLKPDGVYSGVKFKTAVEILLEILVGKFSPLRTKLIEKGLVNDNFEFEFFDTRNTATVIFSGESDNPQAVKSEILAEVDYLRKCGLSESSFIAATKKAFGEHVAAFDRVEGIASMLVECAVTGITLFEHIDAIENLKIEDVKQVLTALDSNKAALSVITGR